MITGGNLSRERLVSFHLIIHRKFDQRQVAWVVGF